MVLKSVEMCDQVSCLESSVNKSTRILWVTHYIPNTALFNPKEIVKYFLTSPCQGSDLSSLGRLTFTAGVPLLVLLMPRALDHLRTVPLRTPPHSSQLLTEFASVRWNGPGQLKVPPQSSLSYFRAIGATTSPVRTYSSR